MKRKLLIISGIAIIHFALSLMEVSYIAGNALSLAVVGATSQTFFGTVGVILLFPFAVLMLPAIALLHGLGFESESAMSVCAILLLLFNSVFWGVSIPWIIGRASRWRRRRSNKQMEGTAV